MTGRVAVLVAQCRAIAAIYDETFPDRAQYAYAYRRSGVNPFHRITASGLYLEFYYGYPSRLWTPGGTWFFTGGTGTPPFTTAEKRVKPFMARLGTSMHEPRIQSRWGSYGPVYAVHRVDGGPVEPNGAVGNMRPTDIDRYRELKREWAALGEGWVPPSMVGHGQD